MAALMARQADALYAKASMKNVRVDSLKDAAHDLHQSADALAKGNIEQMKEYRKMAVSSLQKAEANLSAGPNGSMDAKGSTGALDHAVESGPTRRRRSTRTRLRSTTKRSMALCREAGGSFRCA